MRMRFTSFSRSSHAQGPASRGDGAVVMAGSSETDEGWRRRSVTRSVHLGWNLQRSYRAKAVPWVGRRGTAVPPGNELGARIGDQAELGARVTARCGWTCAELAGDVAELLFDRVEGLTCQLSRCAGSACPGHAEPGLQLPGGQLLDQARQRARRLARRRGGGLLAERPQQGQAAERDARGLSVAFLAFWQTWLPLRRDRR